MLWLLLSLLPSSLALVCFNCGDYMGVRSVCSASSSCTGTRCLIVHLNNSTNFAADCYLSPSQAEDFCWTDAQNRTLCSCKTKFCNSPTAVENMTVSQTNLLPEVDIDTMLLSITTTTLPITTVIGSETMPSVTGETITTIVEQPTGGVPEVTTIGAGTTGETAADVTVSGAPDGDVSTASPTPAQHVPEGSSTAAPVETTPNLGSFHAIPLLVIFSTIFL